MSKRPSERALGLLLVVLPLCAGALQPSRVQAQPVLVPPLKKARSPLTAQQRESFNKIMAIARIQEVCATTLDLKMDGATLDDVVGRLKPAFQTKKVSIEVRGAKPIQVSFDLKGSSVGNLLTPISALAGCKLYMFSSGLLIAPPSQLTETEKLELQQGRGGEWVRSSNTTQHEGWTLQEVTTPSPDKQRAMGACASVLNLKLEDGTFDEVLNHIKGSLTNQTLPIETRGANPIQVSFDLQGISVGNALTSVAALAGCDVYILNSGVLITSPDQLTESEKLELKQNQGGVWQDNRDKGDYYVGARVVDGTSHPGWSVQTEARKLFSEVVSQEAMKIPTGTTTFGNFSPDSQVMLQQMANWFFQDLGAISSSMTPLQLTTNSSVSVTSSPQSIRIVMKDMTSDNNNTVIDMITSK